MSWANAPAHRVSSAWGSSGGGPGGSGGHTDVSFFDESEKLVDQARVAPPTFDFAPKLRHRLGDRKGRLVGPPRRQRVEDVDDADDLSEAGDVAASQTVGVAGAVEPLVMMSNDRAHPGQGTQAAAQPLANRGMLFHLRVLVRRE